MQVSLLYEWFGDRGLRKRLIGVHFLVGQVTQHAFFSFGLFLFFFFASGIESSLSQFLVAALAATLSPNCLQDQRQ